MIRIQDSKTKVIVIVAILALIAIAGVIYANNSSVVATVGGEKISKDDLYDYLVRQNGQQALDILVTHKIIELEAKKQNIAITEADLEKELVKVKDYYGGEEAFDQALAAAGLSVDYIKNDLETNIKVKKLMEPLISITEEEMAAFFKENKELFATEEQVKVKHILTNTEEEAAQIKAKLAEGSDFAQLAKEYSIDSTNKEYGGDLGLIKRGEMVKEFEDAAFSLKLDEISDPVKTEYGYHIIMVSEHIAAQEANYEESKEKIKEMLFEEKMQTEYYTWLDEKYELYKIENRLLD